MGSKIQVLSDQTINQIAAGEVIENPASVVKELVENAVDAGASHVKVEIFGGGFQRIKLSDDGSGMSPEDALLCLQRHATSKMTCAEDLFSLTTMGFRGEALASIAAVSHLTLCSALEGEEAVAVEMEGGTLLHVTPAARARGTTIEVRSLFFNVPARKKFQKSPAASSAAITKVLTQLALAHPGVGFELIQQGSVHLSVPPSSTSGDFLEVLKRRADVLLGKEFILPLECSYGKGFLAAPLLARSNRSGQYLFVNHRPVVCPLISYAVQDAYGTRLPTGRHPVYLLHLFISPELIDVNVHPQKKEIRLREEGSVKQAIYAAVNSALSGVERPALAVESPALASFFSQPSYPDFSFPQVLQEEEAERPLELALERPIRAVGVYGKYLIVEASSVLVEPPSGVVWIDLFAAEARLQFDALLLNAGQAPASQGLLFPVTVHVSKAEMQLLLELRERMHQLGLQWRQIGDTALLVEGIPPFMQESEVHGVLMEMLDECQDKTLRSLAAGLSRRAHLRKRPYFLEEAVQIVKKLMGADDPIHCPLGKQTMYHITEDEIESCFTTKK